MRERERGGGRERKKKERDRARVREREPPGKIVNGRWSRAKFVCLPKTLMNANAARVPFARSAINGSGQTHCVSGSNLQAARECLWQSRIERLTVTGGSFLSCLLNEENR